MRGINLKSLIEQVSVPVITVSQLLEKHPSLPSILALQVDTEGHDFNVIQSAIEAGCLPKIINYEHRHLSLPDQVACRSLLMSKGYYFHSIHKDTLAVRL